MASLSPEDIAYQQAHIHQNRGPVVVGISAFLIAISTIAVGLRVVARRSRNLPFGWDDAFCVGGLVLLICMCVINFVSVHFGLGRHLLATDPKTGYKIIEAGFFLSITYALTQWFIKMGILFTFIRFFGMRSTWFKYGVYFVIFYVTSWSLSLILAAVTQCRPLDYFWRQFDIALQPPARGHCTVDSNPLVVSTSALNTAADFMLLLLPLPQLWSLNLPWGRKIGVMSIFLVGIFGCVASILRLTTTLTSITAGTDSTWNAADVYIWTSVEACVQLLCACFPIIGPLFGNIPTTIKSVVSSRLSTWSSHSSEKGSPRDSGSLSGATIVEKRESKRFFGSPEKKKWFGYDSWMVSSRGSSDNSQFDREPDSFTSTSVAGACGPNQCGAGACGLNANTDLENGLGHERLASPPPPDGQIMRQDDFSVAFVERNTTAVV